MLNNLEQQMLQDNETDFLDLLQILADNARLIVIGSLGFGLFSLAITFVIPPIYTAKIQFLPPQQQQSSASALLQSLGSMGGGLAAAASGLRNPADQYISFLKTQSIQDAMVATFNLQDRYAEKYKVDARKELTANTKISTGKDSIIQIEVDDEDPKFASDMANGYVLELRRLMARLSLTEAQQRRTFFENKVQEAKIDLATADKSLRSTGVNASTLKSSPLAAVEVVARLKGAITAQEVKIGNLRGYLNQSAPEIKQAILELETLRNQLSKSEKNDPITATGALEDTYVERFRDYKYKEALLEMFAKQYELARVDEAREGAFIQVIDPAQPPEKKSKPKRALIAVISTLVAAFLLLLFVFIRQNIRRVYQNEGQFLKLMSIRAAWRHAIGKS